MWIQRIFCQVPKGALGNKFVGHPRVLSSGHIPAYIDMRWVCLCGRLLYRTCSIDCRNYITAIVKLLWMPWPWVWLCCCLPSVIGSTQVALNPAWLWINSHPNELVLQSFTKPNILYSLILLDPTQSQCMLTPRWVKWGVRWTAKASLWQWVALVGGWGSYKGKQYSSYFRIRPYHAECTRSHPNSEVKLHWAGLVLGWGTTREQSGVVSNLFFLLKCPEAGVGK